VPRPNNKLLGTHRDITAVYIRNLFTRLALADPNHRMDILSNEGCPIAVVLRSWTRRPAVVGGGSIFHYEDQPDPQHMNPLLTRCHLALLRFAEAASVPLGDGFECRVTYAEALTLIGDSLHA